MPKEPKAAPEPMMATLTDLGATLAALKNDVTNLVQSGQSKDIKAVLNDIGLLWADLGEIIQGYELPPTMGTDAADKRTECRQICEQILQTVNSEKPRFAAATEAGSITEGSKIDGILQLVQVLLPLLLKLFA
jgi:hypothetical protein